MGTVGRRSVLESKSRSWLAGLALVSWAALLAGACGGSKTTDPGPASAGEPAGGQPGGSDSGPVVSGGASGEGHGGENPGAAAGGIASGGATNVAGSSGLGGRSSGGTGGTGGTGGSPPSVVGSRLGRACVKNSDCHTASETGLTCITETSTVLGSGAPPRGLCTLPCATDDECAAHGAGSLCYALGSSGSYCIEGCEIGSPGLGEAKCHSRPEVVCAPALMASTGDICTDSSDCPPDELCSEGTCNVVFPACVPSCRGDVDCAAGMYCDQSFMGGLCQTQKPTGKRLGEPCTVPAADQPEEPDGCLGFCQPDSDVGNQGHCSASCGLGHECAWDAASQRFDGICYYASILTAETGAEGDFGFCTPSCNCSEQCNDPALSCQLLDEGGLDQSFKAPGLCFATDATSVPFEECASGGAGAGGAGGAGAGGAGGAGAGGAP